MMTKVILRDGFFYPNLTQIMDSFFFFFCSPLYFYFKNKLPESSEYAKIQFHFNITMTSLDDHLREFQYNHCM